jgi:PhnB protein
MPKPIPDGYHALTPHLSCRDAAKAITFYTQALGAKEIYRLPMPGGKVAHAELRIGDSTMMIADEMPEWGNKSAKTVGASPIGLCFYTDDVEAVADKFCKAGGKVVRPIELQFYGDRSGQFEDPEGYKWTLAQHVEDVSPEEMQKRMARQG